MTCITIRPRGLVAAALCTVLAGTAAFAPVDQGRAQSSALDFDAPLCAPAGFNGTVPEGLVAGYLSVPTSPVPEQKATLCCAELSRLSAESQIEIGARLANEVRLMFEVDESAARTVAASVGACEQSPFTTAFSTALTDDRIGSLLGSLLGSGGEVRPSRAFDTNAGGGGGFYVPSPN